MVKEVTRRKLDIDKCIVLSDAERIKENPFIDKNLLIRNKTGLSVELKKHLSSLHIYEMLVRHERDGFTTKPNKALIEAICKVLNIEEKILIVNY